MGMFCFSSYIVNLIFILSVFFSVSYCSNQKLEGTSSPLFSLKKFLFAICSGYPTSKIDIAALFELVNC